MIHFAVYLKLTQGKSKTKTNKKKDLDKIMILFIILIDMYKRHLSFYY